MVQKWASPAAEGRHIVEIQQTGFSLAKAIHSWKSIFPPQDFGGGMLLLNMSRCSFQDPLSCFHTTMNLP